MDVNITGINVTPLRINNVVISSGVDNDNNKRIYMKFDLKALKNMRINAAKLRLYVLNGSDSKQILKEVKNTTWQESTLTYKSRPATSDTITSITGGKINTWKEIDIIELNEAFILKFNVINRFMN